MQILSWNVNGLRAASRAGFFEWLEKENPDVICLQEIKCQPDQLTMQEQMPLGYQSYWHPAKKPGYSGVAIYSKAKVKKITEGFGIASIDDEGRVLIAEFNDFTLINAYFPNSGRDHLRLPYKLEFCDKMFEFCENLQKNKNPFVLCGDYNIAHQEIDLANPKSNQKNAGFLPEERKWMTKFLQAGHADTFRTFEPGGGHYSWWSYRPGVRERNIGWRIDYHCVSEDIKKEIKNAWIMPSVRGSDHCPVGVEL